MIRFSMDHDICVSGSLWVRRSNNENTVVIVLNLGQRVVGIVVDGVSDVLSLTTDQIRPAPEFAVTLSTEYLTGLGALGDRMLILVNIEKLLNSEEMALLDIAASHVA